tara:strand:- start:715 stop:894 length:180 start_codon:yes stop_codon:yes gene_type:complete
MSEVASLVSYIASFFALVASVTLPEWVAITSIVVAIVGLGITWYYKHKTLQLLKKGAEL